ncbi:envelope protein UL20 [Human alphaherpesvirus 2]|uniref:Envelope protein UL20 n=1 Tax=Human herpesvirus 2 TaxID=10310 RepID=A0A0E3XT21_HHV2|nr:envelope protein UL20 [Human alphaherpesvirus 2]AKC59545.1 envelope protein UL20 [Human alphaherpesvirus 2]SPT06126.1 envelope protein UL20 [Human alphaherpesvirus 2]
MTMRDDVPLLDRELVYEAACGGEDGELPLDEQFSLSSYGTSDFFVSSAYSRLPPHTQPVFSKRVVMFAWSFLVLKPLELVAAGMYYGWTGRAVAPACIIAAVLAYYVTWLARALLLYVNIKRDRLPLSPPVFWGLCVIMGGAALCALVAAAHETFSPDGLFHWITASQLLPRTDPLRARSLGIACAAGAAMWVAAADCFAAFTNFFLARFWTRAILKAPVAF